MFSVDIQPGEKVYKVYRQTEWVLAKTVLVMILGIYAPAFLLVKNELLAEFGRILILWILLVSIYMLYRFLLWRLTCYVITDSRLIVINYPGLFKKQVSDFHLNKIQHLKFSSTGFFSSLLNFGNIEVSADGLETPMLLKHVSKPEDLKNFLWSLKSHFENLKQ